MKTPLHEILIGPASGLVWDARDVGAIALAVLMGYWVNVVERRGERWAEVWPEV